MVLDRIALQHFRLFSQEVFDLHPRVTLIVGKNTRGKTSLLEGVHTILHGEGFRESKEQELICWNQERAALGASFIEDGGGKSEYQVMFKRSGDKTEKHFFVDKTRKTHYAYLRFQTRAVLFTPEHIDIISGAPAQRRGYFDRLLSAADLEYKKRLANYENALRKRNKILEHSSHGELWEELRFWNDYLVENGRYLTAKRAAYCDYLNTHPRIESRLFQIEHKKNEMTIERLRERFDLEKRMKKTSIGPQKDDYEITITDGISKNVHLYGSRSEQRLAMFWLKLNEIRFLKEQTGKKPLLLLDDVFSELDPVNKALVLRLVGEYQTILTTTERELIDLAGSEVKVIEL